MIKATASGCINHPAVEAVARCKQCGKPVCGACVSIAASGKFCSDDCRDKYEKFAVRAQEIDRTARRTGSLQKIWKFVIQVIILCAALGLIGFVAVYFDVPVVADAIKKGIQAVVPGTSLPPSLLK